MPDITQICRAVDFIEANLKRPVTVADIAEEACYSLYHFCRTFNALTHHTPYDYLMRRRLSESALALIQTDKKIIDIAFDYQFNNHETYSRAFKRMFACQPSQVRKLGHVDRRSLMHRLTPAHLRQIGKGPYLRPVLEERASFQVAGIMSLIRTPAATQELWDLLRQELKRGGPALNPNSTYGIIFYPKNWDNLGYLYVAATETQTPSIENAALVIKTIPALTYAKFIHKGTTQELSLTLDYIYHTWLPKSGNTLSCPLIIERYRQDIIQRDRRDAERDIYIPIA